MGLLQQANRGHADTIGAACASVYVAKVFAKLGGESLVMVVSFYIHLFIYLYALLCFLKNLA